MRTIVSAGSALLFLCNFAFADVIGSARNVVRDVKGRLSGVDRIISVGDEVLANEIVRTGPNSATQLQFLDQTNITVGAGSTVVLDKFVYNPDKSAQTTVIKVTQGAIRFVSGRSSPENFTIQTTSATIGIRGTDVTVVCDEKKVCSVVVSSGDVLVCPEVRAGLNGRTIPSLCRNLVRLDPTHNFTSVSSGGKTTGAQSVSATTVSNLNNAVATGQPGVTTASLNSQAGPAAASGPDAGANAGKAAANPDKASTVEADNKYAGDGTNGSSANSFVLTPVTSGGAGGGPVSQ